MQLCVQMQLDVEMQVCKAAPPRPCSDPRQLKQWGTVRMHLAASSTSGSHTQMKMPGRHRHTRMPHLEPTPSGQVTYKVPHMPALSTTRLTNLFNAVYTDTTLSRLEGIYLFHSTRGNKHSKSNKRGRQKNMPQMEE